MLTDDIKQNIMKYLNNGVSGSSQAQKPIALSNYYQINERIFNIAKTNYVTDDNQYIISSMREYATAKYCLKVMSVVATLNEEFAETFYIPDYDTYTFWQVKGLNRLEDGRFYGIFDFTDSNNLVYTYFMILNDFITDGTLIINKAYKLSDFTFTYDREIAYTIFDMVINIPGTGDYIFYMQDKTGIQLDNYATKFKYFVGRLNIRVDGGIEQKEWAFNIKTEATDNATKLLDVSVNVTNETPYLLASYTDTYTNNKPTNYRIGKIYLEDSNNEITTTTIKNLYSNNSYVGATDFQGRYYRRNGTYMNNVLIKQNGNTISLKYVLVQANGTYKDINFPSTISVTNYDYDNISIIDNLLFIGLIGDTTIRSLYKVNINNTIEFIQDISQDPMIPTAEVVIIKQFNLYFVFSLLIWVRMYVIKDVPVYGRATLPKQKLFNSAIFRVIKKYRNRRANIQP